MILSLIFRGFSRAMKDKDTMDGIDLADALNAGVVAAYKAVMKPAEGTVLTVSVWRGTGPAGRRRKTPPLSMCWDRPLSGPGEALADTVNQNPVLKKAGVVDARRHGLCGDPPGNAGRTPRNPGPCRRPGALARPPAGEGGLWGL